MRGVTVLFLLAYAKAEEMKSEMLKSVEQKLENDDQPPFAFAFGGGGLLFPYYVGAAYQLKNVGLLGRTTPLGGASAGSIAAALVAFDIEESVVRASMKRFLDRVRNGASLNAALRPELEKLVPDDFLERAQRHSLAIGYYEVFPQREAHIVTSWKSKEDFIQTVLASCNFPVYFSRWPFVKCRNSWAIDGLFAVEKERFGCPPLPGLRTVAVVAPKPDTNFDASDIIQPGQPGLEFPNGVDDGTWLMWMLSPAPDDKIDEIIEIGKTHARKWAIEQQVANPLKTWMLRRADAAADAESAKEARRQTPADQPESEKQKQPKRQEQPKQLRLPTLAWSQSQPEPQQKFQWPFRKQPEPEPSFQWPWEPRPEPQPLFQWPWQPQPEPQPLWRQVLRRPVSASVARLQIPRGLRIGVPTLMAQATSNVASIPVVLLLGVFAGVAFALSLRARRGDLTTGREPLITPL